MKPLRLLAALPLALLAACVSPQEVQVAAPRAADTANSLDALVEDVSIPYETFTLANGLTTIVHTDRKAPIVGVTVYYRVGSKHEPRGRTGFAHLFEHLMFGGSENVENFDIPLEAAGSTPTNGSTSYDRTNYVETVPTGALDLALFMESDRMGYLLGAVTQEKLDRQRGVVQNEKRQSDNQPYGLVEYRLAERLLPVGHPYRHSVIGSMADLSAASLLDVRQWFRDNYGPNNVVLALTGDIDVATARTAVERWFGDIPEGPEVRQFAAAPVDLPAPLVEEMSDQVPQTRIIRTWTGPSMTDPDAVPLEVGMAILGGLGSSRLDDALVYGEEVATSVYAYSSAYEQISMIQAAMTIAPGADRARAELLFGQAIDKFIAEGPTQDEVRRAATRMIAGQIAGLERVGGFSGKGATLAEGLLYTGDAEFYRRQLERAAALTPEEVRGAVARWLSRPPYTLAVVPGERTLDGATMGGWGDEGTIAPPVPDEGSAVPPGRTAPPREAPAVAALSEFDFPDTQHATLSNGIAVTLAQRSSVPMVSLALTLDAGSAADPAGRAGRHAMMVAMLEEGTTTLDALAIARQEEELGASIAASAGVDASRLYLTSLSANLPRSLALLSDIALRPAFAPDAFARLQNQRLATIAQELASPADIASRAIGPLLFGQAHPYARATTSGDAKVIASITPEELSTEHRSWFRPDLAGFTVVGDIAMEELLPLLESAFGGWQAPAGVAPAKHLDQPMPRQERRLVVIDRPNSPQSVLMLGRVLPITGTQGGMEALELANEVIGNGFLSRLNNNLREVRGWTYGVGSSVSQMAGPRMLTVSTAVQSDRTGDAIRELLREMAAFPDDRPVDATELQRVTEGNVRGLPNRFETNAQVLGALLANQLLGRPDDYQESLPAIYRAVDGAAINRAAAQFLQPDDLVIVVVGDRATIDAQIATLGMPVEYLSAQEL